ncbi:MAG: hypothetical protein JRI73_05495 [Deltaproteobacteria bacterium]|nr:hypothetical protein [Deltaproteobacteria bacterium]
MRRRETLKEITERIETYDKFFGGFGFDCPLPKHLKRTVNSGFPRYNLMVDAHFMAEMCVAEEGEVCRGMGGQEFRTKEGEIVLKDEKEIVCVLCQGADEKTRVGEDTKNVLFYAYGIPGVEGNHLRDGLTIAAETMRDFGEGIIQGVEIY